MKPFCHRCPKKNFSPFCFASPEKIGVKFGNRRTDRQPDKFFDTFYWGMWIFLSVKFASSLLALLAGGWKHYLGNKKFLREEKATNWRQLCCKSQEKRLKANLLKNNPSIIQSWPKYQTIPVFIFSKLQAERSLFHFFKNNQI